MRKILFSAVALFAFFGSAFAADLPATKASPSFIAPASAFSWTGFYIGAQLGGVFGNNNYFVQQNGYARNGRDNGVFGGGHIGYNYQINKFVLGVQVEFNGSSAQGTAYPSSVETYKTRQAWFGSVDERLGYAIGDRALIYAIGGFAFGNSQHENIQTANIVNGQYPAVTFARAVVGFDIGAGVEYVLTDKWTARVEYRYYDFPRQYWSATPICSICGNNYYAHAFLQYNSIVKLGLSYKFGAPEAQVVAKY